MQAKCPRRSGRRAHNWKGGRTRNADGYVLVYCPEHAGATKHGYVYEHRLVVEAHLGRLLGSAEVIHHRNGDKADNRLENLELTTQAEHMRGHRTGTLGERTVAATPEILRLRSVGVLVADIVAAVGLSEPTVLKVLSSHPIRCGFCDREFGRLKALGMHLSRSHREAVTRAKKELTFAGPMPSVLF